MGGLVGGGSKSGGGGGSGISDFDIAALQQAVGQNIEMLHNRYTQLGLGVPSGDPAQAAKAGQSLHYAGPGTAEQTDIQGQHNILQAGLGQLQINNASNAAVPGSFANLAQNQSNLGNLASQLNFNTGAQSQIG